MRYSYIKPLGRHNDNKTTQSNWVDLQSQWPRRQVTKETDRNPQMHTSCECFIKEFLAGYYYHKSLIISSLKMLEMLQQKLLLKELCKTTARTSEIHKYCLLLFSMVDIQKIIIIFKMIMIPWCFFPFYTKF